MNNSSYNQGASLGAEQIVDTVVYPINAAGTREYKDLVRRCRNQMSSAGVCLLHDFITPRALEMIRREATSRLGDTHYCHNSHNVYLRDDDPVYAENHPRRRRLQTDVGSIAYDYLPQPGTLTALYQWDCLTSFLADVLDIGELYQLADPLGALSINVFEPGGSHAWHFDESAFSVTLMVQEAERGGLFQYEANVRSEDDDNHQRVGQILDGDESAVETLPLRPGTLSIFAGRHTLHRVTPVEGSRHRLVPVLCYATKPNVQNSPAVRELFWGRAG